MKPVKIKPGTMAAIIFPGKKYFVIEFVQKIADAAVKPCELCEARRDKGKEGLGR